MLSLASHRIASHRHTSHRIASPPLASHRIASHRIASPHLASHRIASHRIASHRRTARALSEAALHTVPLQAIEASGATLINTGIGWHEARIPTIATSVPRGGFAWVTQKLRGSISVPLVATNRINTPEVAEAVLSSGQVRTRGGGASHAAPSQALHQRCSSHSHAIRMPPSLR